MLCIVPSFTAIMPAESIAFAAPSSVVITTVTMGACAIVTPLALRRDLRRAFVTALHTTTHTRTTRSSRTTATDSHPLNP